MMKTNMLLKAINIRNLFSKRFFASLSPEVSSLQRSALTEKCILVDETDKRLGFASKLDCHKIPVNGEMLLHRAFSVFLFNCNNELLIHKRAASKVTFPMHITNSCCSHPIADYPEELEEINAVGVKHAAKRRLNYELGIPLEEIDLNDFTYLTRFLYKSHGDGIWGEYELDYVLFMRKDVTLNPNLDEVSEVTFVKQEMLDKYLKSQPDPLTPWFQLIVKNLLPAWWSNLSDLQKYQEHQIIQRFL